MSNLNGRTSSPSKNKRKVVSVVLLNGTQLVVHVDVKAKLYEVFNQVAAHLSLRETEYFGLAIIRDEEYHFLTLDEKISKVAPKRWKSVPGEGLDSENKPLLTVWFRVQFYVDQVVLLREKVTRHLYYLQLKENVLRYNHLYNEEKCFQLAGYALQADFGNFIPEKHTAGYFDPRQYLPTWMLEKHGCDYLSDNCPFIHRDMHGITRTDAELKYVRECSMPPGAHNLHFYRVRKKKTDKTCNTWLAICARGVEVYEDDAGFKNLISTFLWPDIGKLYFDKKKFEIRSVANAGGRRFTYYTESDTTSKYLLHICRSTHMFQMAIHPKLMEIRHLDAEDKKRYRESYIYSDARDLVINGGLVQFRANRSPGKSPAGTQRCSVISDASSNTTSGIVSDKMAISFDEGEEHSKEIIIDCPPRQNQALSKMQFMGSYKMTPPTPGSRSTALPPQTLELFRSPGSSGKNSPGSAHAQELSPVINSGSYRAKLHQTTHTLYGGGKPQSYMLPTPSPSSPSQPYTIPMPSPSSPHDRDFPGPSIARSASCKENFKGFQGSTLVAERNVSGDSTTTSGSTASTGIVSLSLENSPVIQPASLAAGVSGGMGQYVKSSVSGSPKFCLGSPAPSFVQPLVSVAPASSSGLMTSYQVDKTPSPLVHSVVAQLVVPDTPSPHHHLAPTLPAEHLYTDRTELKQQAQETLVSSLAYAEMSQGADLTSVNKIMGLQPEQKRSNASSQVCNIGASGGVQYVHGHGGSVDSGNVLSDESSSTYHSAQSSEDDCGVKEIYESVVTSPKSPAHRKAHKTSGTGKPTHVSVKNQKEALHPELEQILGQSHAHSLPLITALCNDLMTGSSHSSTGSYDTATLHSADLRLARMSGEAASRRWSTCDQGELASDAASLEAGGGSTGTMLLVGGGASGARPYSWHSEHFDLDLSLSAAAHSKGTFHHQLQLDNHRSVPHNLCTCSSTAGGGPVLWTQAVANSCAPYGGSLDRYSPDLIVQHQMIPSRLSSGGHNNTDGNISHHKGLKENIGIA